MKEVYPLIKTNELNDTAYSLLYEEYFKKLYNYGKKLTHNPEAIRDAIQEVFLDFWTKQEKLTRAENLPAYFFSSFRYVLLKNLKRSGRTVFSDKLTGEPDFSIEHFLIARETEDELQAKIRPALQSLTPRQREAIFLRFYEGMSYEEVAAVLNISVKATYKLMSRSLDALRDVLLCPVFLLFLLRGFAA